MEAKKKYLYFGIGGVALLVLILAAMKKTPAASDTSGGFQQPILVTGSDTEAVKAIEQLQLNQETIRSDVAASVQGQQNIVETINKGLENLNQVTAAQKQNQVAHTFFGGDVDLANAQTVFEGDVNKFVNTTGMSEVQIRDELKKASNPIIVGGPGAVGGVSSSASAGSGIVRVGGADRVETLKLLQGIR